MTAPGTIARHRVAPSELDCTLPGIQHIGVRIEAADGEIEHLPVSILNREDGPSLLITAGIHGDEFEGPAALLDLVRRLEALPIRGRLILVPTANPAALAASARRSPVDGRDLNRSFRAGASSISEAIADFLVAHLLPAAEAVLDLHAAGRALIMPSVMLDPRPTDRQGFRRSLGMARAFGADAVLVIEQEETGAMLDGAVMASGKAFVCAEIGSAAVLTPKSAALAEAGVARVLDHLGLTAGQSDRAMSPRALLAIGEDLTVRTTASGFLRPLVEIGAKVRAGDALARLIDLAGAAPDAFIRAARTGVVYNIAGGGPVEAGAFVATIAEELPPLPNDDAIWAASFERHLPPYQE
ncbi:hypothetical protein HL653_03350 [Sphingomonas sp. AP4-R1]|uniref:succinylglutamate desuccinylase/aspartoacylase family protein n=1 Tax=Sphingomonas sp. AP4-R1 TaxID=2735134 RepID=UPI00149361D1|nr:succinylglutamate desuccinylase/aspartoacylase family protein [Sphingomonas sp. AP4-R1]QJU56952.1 hypothetical protein HL653_03350 [Sphingomonas sp. AP4-R1]